MILNLLIFGVIWAGLVVVIIALLYLTDNQAIHSHFKRIATYTFLFIVSGVTFFPFSHLDLASLASPEKSLLSGGLLLFFYAFVFLLLRIPIKEIATNIIVLFQQRYLGIYIGLIFFSVLWSQTHLVTLKSAISLILISSFAVYFARQYDYPEFIKLLRWNQTFVAIASAFMSIFVPSEGIIEKGWAGAIGHPINLGNMMAFTSVLWLFNAIQNRKYRFRSIIFSILCIVIMQLANSAGAFIVFLSLLTILLVPFVFRKLNFLQANFLFTLILSLFSFPSILLFGNFSNTISLLGKDLTFTGRVPLWNLLIESNLREHLWLGYGYSGFWQPWQGSDNPAANIFHFIGDWAVHAHNGFLDIALNLGLVGLSLFVLSLICNFRRAIKLIFKDRRPEAVLPLMILTFAFVSNLSQTSIISPGYIWFVYVIVTAKLEIEFCNKKNKRYIDFSRIA